MFGMSSDAIAVMVRSLIGADGMAQIDELISSGAIQKVQKFAEGLEELNGRLATIELLLVVAGSGSADAGPVGPDGDRVPGESGAD